MAGGSLNEAYEEAVAREQAASSIEGRAATLRTAAPDLSEKVSGAARERGSLFQPDVADEGVGVPVHEFPVGAASAVDLGNAQRPVLVREPAHLTALPL